MKSKILGNWSNLGLMYNPYMNIYFYELLTE